VQTQAIDIEPNMGRPGRFNPGTEAWQKQ